MFCIVVLDFVFISCDCGNDSKLVLDDEISRGVIFFFLFFVICIWDFSLLMCFVVLLVFFVVGVFLFDLGLEVLFVFLFLIVLLFFVLLFFVDLVLFVVVVVLFFEVVVVVVGRFFIRVFIWDLVFCNLLVLL